MARLFYIKTIKIFWYLITIKVIKIPMNFVYLHEYQLYKLIVIR